MHVINIKSYRFNLNKVTGEKTSIFSAAPHVSSDDWSVVTDGYTFEMSNGTFGMGKPAQSVSEAVERAYAVNAKRIRDLTEHFLNYPEHRDTIRDKIDAIKVTFPEIEGAE